MWGSDVDGTVQLPTHPQTTSHGAADDAPAVVEVRGLWTAFGSGKNRVVIHKDLDLTIERGEILSLVGGSGTGKTVLLRQILGLESPEKGTVTVLGEPASRLGRRGAASRVGMLFQQGALFSAFNVIDNIAFALRELGTLPVALAREAALVKLQMVGLKPGDALKMPSDLSGGMIKRVALARALIMDPPLLLLDEPTAGLDPAGSDAFCDLLRDLHTELGLTVVMVTHDLDTLFDLSTRVAVLAEQHVLTSGTPAEVAQFDHPFVQEYFQGMRGRRAQISDPPQLDSTPPQATHFVSSPTPPGGQHQQPGEAGSAVFSRDTGAAVDALPPANASGK
jgi:phospholipid/cholesterol/gamma-HCH transport system ATP-binding protein